MKRLFTCVMLSLSVVAAMETKAQQPFQEVYGTLFNTGQYITEDVYARQFHDRSAIAGNKMRLLHIAEAFYNSGTFHSGNDSISLVYSGERGWDTVLNEWAYDTLNHFIVTLPMWRQYAADGRVDMNYYAFNANLPQRRIITYASNGKVASYTYEELVGGISWEKKKQFNYSYDATYRRTQEASDDELITYNNGLFDELKSIETSKKVNNTWKLSNGRYYQYDTTTKKVREIIHSVVLPNGNFSETGRTAYVYDWNLRPTVMYNIKTKGLLAKDTLKTTYEYNDSGCISIMTITKVLPDGTDSNINRVELRYNYRNQVTSERIQYWSRSTQSWMYEKEKRYHYQTIWPVNVEDKAKQILMEVQVYPVPAKGRITVALNGAGTGNTSIVLSGMNGAILRKWEFKNMGNDFRQDLDINGLAAGNYMLSIETNAGVVTKKIVVE